MALKASSVAAEEGESEHKEHRLWLYLAASLAVTIVVSSLLDWLATGVSLGFSLPLTSQSASVSALVYHVVVVSVAVYVGYVGLKELLVDRRFSVEFLMSAAALGAVYLGYLFEAATVLLLYSLAEYSEHYIEDRARRAVEKLSAYMPENARVAEDGVERMVDVKQVKVGEIILVRAGERIPLDGVVMAGVSSVDQSLVTGESAPICKNEGDAVFAGTLNAEGVLTVQVAKEVNETLVSRIARLMMEARKRKASMERLVDRFARFYVPIIVFLAVFVGFGMPFVAGGSSQVWIYRSLILLVVSCPSAFVLSVPATFFAAIASAARKGVIIKGGFFVEKMARVRTVVFDKTGTLTLGQPAVREVNCMNEANDQRALMYAAALEQYSNHPLAQGFVQRASENGFECHTLEVKDVREVAGKGIVGNVGGCHVVVGNADLMTDEGVDMSSVSVVGNEKHTRVYVSINKCAPPSFCLADQVRDDAADAVEALKNSGVHTVILTGDKAQIAEEVSKRLGVDETRADLFPEDKLKIVDGLRAERGFIAMIGDGINDAPALAASDVGIAMGSGGVDVALESADVVLVKNELNKIPYLRRLSSLAVKIAKQNIAVSLGVKLLLGALGYVGLVPLWFAVAVGDDGVTMLLLLNTLRLPRVKL